MDLAPWSGQSSSLRDRSPPRNKIHDSAQIRDAEMSVEYLCRRFEAFSDQLRQQEQARENAERRGKHLAAEVESAEAAVTKRSSALAAELSENDSSLAVLRASASGVSKRVAFEAEKAREEHASENALEQQCATMSEICRAEASRCEQAVAQLAVHDREVVHERAAQGEASRKLRQRQADMRVSMEDLRIAQQRSLLVRNEFQTLEAGLEAVGRLSQEAAQESEAHRLQLLDRRRQLNEHQTRLEALVASVEASHSENLRQEQCLRTVQDEEAGCQNQIASLHQEMHAAQHELETRSKELQAEAEVAATLAQELMSTERRRAVDAQELTAHLRGIAEVEATLDTLRQNVSQVHTSKDTTVRQLDQLTAEDQHHSSAASAVRRTRHTEDLAFSDVQSELQIAFRRREQLGEELALGARTRDQLLAQLRDLRPEVAEMDDSCRYLEDQLAKRAREVEEELVQQRSCQQELVTFSEAAHELEQQEARLEAEFTGRPSDRSPRGPPEFSSSQSSHRLGPGPGSIGTPGRYTGGAGTGAWRQSPPLVPPRPSGVHPAWSSPAPTPRLMPSQLRPSGMIAT